jgi:pectinesterase
MSFTADPGAGWASQWELYPEPVASGLGTGIVFPSGVLSGMAEDDLNHLALVKVRSGEPVRYYTGAGWVHSGDFASEADWRAYLAAFSARIAAPLSVSIN